MTEQERAVIEAAREWRHMYSAYHYTMTKKMVRLDHTLTSDETALVKAAVAAEDRLRDAIDALLTTHPDAGRGE